MADLSSLSPQLDAKKCTCRAIIDTPKGCRNKFAYDPESGLFMLRGLLPEGMMFPFDFGFVPSTLAGCGKSLFPARNAHFRRLVERSFNSLRVLTKWLSGAQGTFSAAC